MATTFTSVLNISESITTGLFPESDFIPDNGNLYPKLEDKVSKATVEVWLFDATAEDGSSALTISFFRDAMAAPAGFRIAINATWADGTIWGKLLVFPESVITSEGPDPNSGTVVGVWRTDKDSSSAAFEVAADLSTAKVTFDVPGQIVGTLTLKSLGFATLPKTAKDAEAGPRIYWMMPIAMADATVDLTFTSQTSDGETTDRRMVIGKADRAFGGMDRSWDSVGWVKACSDSVFLRAKTGPYVLQYMLLVGKAAQNHPITANARLYRDGKLVCKPQRVFGENDNALTQGGGDTMVVKRLFEGEGLPAVFRHKNVGYHLEFRSNGQRWLFDTRHHRAWYCKPHGPPGPNSTGASGFIVSVTGGSVNGSESFQGWGFEGQVVLPDQINM